MVYKENLLRLVLMPEKPVSQVRHDGARTEHNPLLGQKLEGDGSLRETLLGEEGRVREHQIEAFAHLTRNVQRRPIVVEHEIAAVHGKTRVEFEDFERNFVGAGFGIVC